MAIEVAINGSTNASHAYVSWASSSLEIKQSGGAGIDVTLRSAGTPGGGRVQFRQGRGNPYADELTLTLPADGGVELTVAGKFGYPSIADRDAGIDVLDTQGNVLTTKRLMVRVRKNADTLTADERDLFLSTFVRLNSMDAAGVIGFMDIQSMHTGPSDPEIHQRPAFLPWHRAFLLDLERRMQAIEPAVAMHYWRFDRPAPTVFVREFMGRPTRTGELDFTASNPLINWVSRVPGAGSPRIRRYNLIVRRNRMGEVVEVTPYDPALERARGVQNGQKDTLNLGREPGTGRQSFARFRRMEIDPHGAAHVSFFGQISSPSSAPGDPLFFMLHSNVDRLWAQWQNLYDRYDVAAPEAYPHQGQGPRVPSSPRVGDYTEDTMWPWNQDIQRPRPQHAPGKGLPPGLTTAPDAKPTVAQMLDFQGELDDGANLGFGYDDVECVHV